MTNKSALAFIGIGSNLKDKEDNIHKAIKLIRGLDTTKVLDISSLYKTSPVGLLDQDWFINAVIKISTSLSPNALMNSLLGIEDKMGRIRREKWGERIIDLDILFYDDIILNEEGITLPHLYLHERKFVLKPFLDIDPDFVHPVFMKSIRQLYDELENDEEVIKIRENADQTNL